MSRHLSHLNTAVAVIKEYKGEVPLHIHLKNLFAKEKKYGSKDRKAITALCYYYFRLGHGEVERSIEERILSGIYLCGHQHNDLLYLLKPSWNETIHLPLQEKLIRIENFYPANIFSWKEQLSEEIEADAFSLSFLIQPKLFIRLRPGHYDTCRQKLLKANIPFEDIQDNCLAFENGTKIESVLEVNKEYVVQDYNSQRVADFLSTINNQSSTPVWDCCAASGGKAILAYDVMRHIELTVSDVRASILHNLRLRFKEAGINHYEYFIADITNKDNLRSAVDKKQFDLIICDAPCSGSGTWSRTPEQLTFFKKERIEKYANLQQAIVRNVIPHIKKGGYLLYITCSVFREENENIVKHILEHSSLQLVKMELLKGYSIKADTMFAALFEKVERSNFIPTSS